MFKKLEIRYNRIISTLSLGTYTPGVSNSYENCRRIVVAALIFRKHLINQYYFDVANPSLLRSVLRNDKLYNNVIHRSRTLKLNIHYKLIKFAKDHANKHLLKV